MTRNSICTAIALACVAAPALAIETEIDVNGDGAYSLTEVQSVLPDMTTDNFLVLDANGDGLLDKSEVAAAIEAGFLPDPAS